MKLRYKIFYDYDYPTNAVIVTLESKWHTKEYPVANLQNLAAVLGHALLDFNTLHEEVIEEMTDNDKIEEAKRRKAAKPGSQEFKGK